MYKEPRARNHLLSTSESGCDPAALIPFLIVGTIDHQKQSILVVKLGSFSLFASSAGVVHVK